MSNSEFLSQFKEEFQKLEQQRTELDQKVKELLLQKIEDNKTIIQELKTINFTFTYHDDADLQTTHGAIIGYNGQLLYVVTCENDISEIGVVDRINDILINSISINTFCKKFDVVLAIRSLNTLKNQMAELLEEYRKDNEKLLHSISILSQS